MPSTDKQVYDDQLITQYLLGSLPAEEAERLDELSVIDDDFSARLKVIEYDLVDSFTRGELSGKTLEQFTSHYLASSLRQTRVGFARTLQNLGSTFLQTQSAVSDRVREDSPEEYRSVNQSKRWFKILALPSIQWGLVAACILLLLGGAWLFVANARLNRQVAEARAGHDSADQRSHELESQLQREKTATVEQSKELEDLRERVAQLEQRDSGASTGTTSRHLNILSFLLTPQLRGAGSLQQLTVQADVDFVAFKVELETADYPFCQAVLRSLSDNHVIWSSRRLRTQSRSQSPSVIVNLPANLLQSQNYSLQVVGLSGTGKRDPLGNYPFRVLRN